MLKFVFSMSHIFHVIIYSMEKIFISAVLGENNKKQYYKN